MRYVRDYYSCELRINPNMRAVRVQFHVLGRDGRLVSISSTSLQVSTIFGIVWRQKEQMSLFLQVCKRTLLSEESDGNQPRAPRQTNMEHKEKNMLRVLRRAF